MEDRNWSTREMVVNREDRCGTNLSVNLDHFFFLSVIGRGNYAKVVLAKKKDDGLLYALKILDKSDIRTPQSQKLVLIERNILTRMSHPFIIKLSWAFQTSEQLYFVLEYCPGGELFNLLQRVRVFTEEQ
jgi:serum/glucocorticoid-regulated kinase 2